MLNDYTYVDAKRRIDKHLAPFFGNKRMSSSMASDIRACIAKRLADTYLARPVRRTWSGRVFPMKLSGHKTRSVSIVIMS